MSDATAITRSFAQLVQQLEDGRLERSLAAEVERINAALSEAADASGGKAKATLTLKLTFDLDDGLVEIQPEVTTKVPKEKRGRSVFWMTPEHHLSRKNPAQPELPLRDVSAPGVRSI